MATGAIDANGVWQYGEDDSVSPWSPYMNLLAASASTQLGLLKPLLTAVVASTATSQAATATETVVAGSQLNLGVGTWLIEGKGHMDFSLASQTNFTVTIRSGTTTAGTLLDTAVMSSGGTNGTIPFALLSLPLVLAAAGNVVMTIKAGASVGGVQNISGIRLVARRVVA